MSRISVSNRTRRWLALRLTDVDEEGILRL